MLGITHAATVGINFPVSYSSTVGNYINYVNAPAFGIPQSGWQSLSPTGTGYGGTTAGLLYLYGINEIDTTMHAPANTSPSAVPPDSFPGQFLNPLPNGSLTVSWGCPTANWSGFAGYDPSHAAQPDPTHGPGMGEAEVYAGFFRDGINFGPPGGPNNNQPGWNVDITGLKSLFTNTPFVIELVAASDSMYGLTNAFIVDVTGNTTQSVFYPNPQHYGDAGDAPWFRATGGGLSTATPTALNTDHVYIYPNRPQHSAGPTHAESINNAATLSGIIITDKPVVSMSPHQVLVSGGDTVAWSGYAVGVPPLSYQWRKNGVPIAGATTSDYGITNVTMSAIGTYDLRVTNLYGAALSSPVTIGDEISMLRIKNLVLDSNPKGPEHDGLNYGAAWLASSADGASVTRTGAMSFSASGTNQITIAGQTNFDSSTGTIMFWMRSSGLGDPFGNQAALFDRLSGTLFKGTGCVIEQNGDGTLYFVAYSKANGGQVCLVPTSPVSDNNWHQVAVVYDQSVTGPLGKVTIYIDGQPNNNTALSADWSWQPGQEIELGLSHDTNSFQPYNGLMDDVRFYNRALSDSEVLSAYSGVLVDTNALVMQLNFTAAPGQGITLTWQATDAVLQSADSVAGPYTDVPGAVSPYNVSVQKTARFYRYRGHTPSTLIANPYLM
jgi:hypothetical protein